MGGGQNFLGWPKGGTSFGMTKYGLMEAPQNSHRTSLQAINVNKYKELDNPLSRNRTRVWFHACGALDVTTCLPAGLSAIEKLQKVT